MNLSGPALAPPAGVTSNFDNPPNNNPLAIGVFAKCASVATICILLKAYASLWIAREVQIEGRDASGVSSMPIYV
ncbi:hypothetical protein N7493_011370 [Penicillium malachiteum]|uniref:Uncharacterized protein n=1 Tax=Penicillium malachiteum TaxID=1324776 RepID=A0AAD6HC69_9EURO|nr:hypothetical protein N7493_011370 [Penicillium malachiteum]